MISQQRVLRVVEKHGLEPLKTPELPRASLMQVVKELKEKGFDNATISEELEVDERTVQTILRVAS